MIDEANRKKFVQNFRLMQEIEESVRDEYLEVSEDADVCAAGIAEEFRQVSQREVKHIEIVEKIIELIEQRL
ncbi:MAG: hypothetical protein FVQ80_12780 [Planctomycetes bacterium]|nr:hypothetical protein [Planctomycetota bacterium]